MKQPSVISFIVLLSMLTLAYVMFMDNLILTVKSKIDNLFK
jgi:hypothetical protein